MIQQRMQYLYWMSVSIDMIDHKSYSQITAGKFYANFGGMKASGMSKFQQYLIERLRRYIILKLMAR
jgi:hypothetical protein